ncbi:MAG: hypothetical protein RI964_3196 [Pseudomonadota bacterium]|jgi:uncharacterized protein YbcC (UPF0753/DUF2309 family)
MSQTPQHPQHSPREYLHQAILALDKVLPIQAPLQDFVHFNPLMHYEHLPFAEALRTVHQQSGSLGYLPAVEYRQFYQQGRITRADVVAILQADGIPAADHELYLTILTHDIKAISFQQMRWQVEEQHALESLQPDVNATSRERLLRGRNEAVVVRELWESCLQRFGLHYALPHPEALLNLMVQQGQSGQGIPDAESLIHAQSREQLHQLIAQVGTRLSLRGLLQALTQTDVMEHILPSLGQYMAAWLDQGVAALAANHLADNFFSFWRDAALRDIAPRLQGLETWQDYLESLDDDPIDTIHHELMRIGIPQQHWDDYLRVLALELAGWSGMFNWRARHPQYAQTTTRVELADYLAVRLVTEHLYCRSLTRQHWQIDASITDLRGYFHHNLDEFFVRYHAYNTPLPEYLQQLAQQFLTSKLDIQAHEWHQLAHQILTWNLAPESIIPVGTDIYHQAWRVFHLAQHLGLDAAAINALPMTQLEHFLGVLHAVDDPHTSGYLWLRAYERHYQQQVFRQVLSKARTQPSTATLPHLSAPPTAQWVFCMDDREESTRRALEALAPDMETFGMAGVFGLPNQWQALDAPQALKLAPPVVTPTHTFREVPTAPAAHRLPLHQRVQVGWQHWANLKQHATRHRTFSTLFALPLLAPLGLLELLGRSFFPAPFQTLAQQTRHALSAPLTTRVQTALSLAEKVEKVAFFLQLNGFSKGFAPLVVFMAHRARHLNNPHLLGYGCGACSGRFGGPNARAFADIANETAVREQLAVQYNIHLPDGCWFVAAEHDTTSDDVDWFDVDLIPATHAELFERVQQLATQAVQHSAQERCLKFASAPVNPSPRRAKRHVAARAASPDQARAELGHQGCALAFIGRRGLSKGVSWERRSFLISYDPTQDPHGHWLETQLQGNGVVGVGIALDYYFSRMQNGYFGSGSKVTHNLTGMFGVMEGGNSDLRTGLAQQMVELHEPMRLLVIVEASVATATAIYQRHAYLRQLLDNGWVLLAVKPPDAAEMHCFVAGKGFVAWQEDDHV